MKLQRTNCALISGIALILFPAALHAATILTSTSAPTVFLSDAFNASEGSAYRIQNGGPGGQSFTHTTGGGEAWRLDSITFRSFDNTGTSDEPATGLEMRIYSGQSTAGANLLQTFTFINSTFDASPGNYMTFKLSSVESATLGDLASGSTYTITLAPTGGNGTDFRIRRSTSNVYNGGQGVFNNGFQGGHDAAFWVTAVPEPSSTALLGLGAVALMIRRRR